MRILALETSAKAVSCALLEDGKRLAFSFQNSGLTHSRTLMPMVDDMLRNCECDKHSIDVIACAVGPGSFTGLRIGIAAAKGLAWGLEKPCAGVSTLLAMAAQMEKTDDIVVAVMDARRNQFYNAVFDCSSGEPRRLCEDRAIDINELADELEKLGKSVLLVGDGAQLCCELLSKRGAAFPFRIAGEDHRWQSAWGVALCAYEMAKKGELVSAEALTPVYLRLSQAERERLERLEREGKTE